MVAWNGAASLIDRAIDVGYDQPDAYLKRARYEQTTMTRMARVRMRGGY